MRTLTKEQEAPAIALVWIDVSRLGIIRSVAGCVSPGSIQWRKFVVRILPADDPREEITGTVAQCLRAVSSDFLQVALFRHWSRLAGWLLRAAEALCDCMLRSRWRFEIWMIFHWMCWLCQDHRSGSQGLGTRPPGKNMEYISSQVAPHSMVINLIFSTDIRSC